MTTDEKYHRIPGTLLRKDSREVLTAPSSVHFRCPCGERRVAVHTPPHTAEFDDAGLLTIEQSCGSKADAERGRPANWCHFWIKSGVPEMCGDAKCPGGTA